MCLTLQQISDSDCVSCPEDNMEWEDLRVKDQRVVKSERGVFFYLLWTNLEQRPYCPPMLGFLGEAGIKWMVEVCRKINGFQSEWDGERSKTHQTVNLSGRARTVNQLRVVRAVEFALRQKDQDYKDSPWFSIILLWQFDRVLSFTRPCSRFLPHYLSVVVSSGKCK